MRSWLIPVVVLSMLTACQGRNESRWQEGYEDGCSFARGATKEQCEARADEIEGLDADYRAGWIEGFETCKFGPDGC